MNQNQVRLEQPSNLQTVSQSRTSLPDKLYLDLPGMAGTTEWSFSTLANYLFRAVAAHEDGIRTLVLPCQSNDALLIELSEAISISDDFVQNDSNLSENIAVFGPSLVGYASYSPEEAFLRVCCALVRNSDLLIEKLYRKTPGEEPGAEIGNIYLAEALYIAVRVVPSGEDAMHILAKEVKFRDLAWQARAALIRSYVCAEPEPDHVPERRNHLPVKWPHARFTGKGQ
jgi:hypothetical protein